MVRRRIRGALLLGWSLPALAAPADLLLEAQLEPAQVYVQTHANYRLRFYQGVDVRELKITGPSAALADFRQIGADRVYEAVRAGRRYRVHERNYALFPYASGALEIAGARVEGRSAAAAVRLEAAPRRLAVVPVPAGLALAAQSLSLSETWSAHAGALRRRIRIEAVGVDAGQLPALRFELAGLNVHAEPARLENRWRGAANIAAREQDFTLTLPPGGAILVPELRLAWWHVDRAQAATATLPSRQLGTPAATPAANPELTAPPPWVLAILGLFLPAVVIWRRRRPLLARWRLHRACRCGRAAAVRDALLASAALCWPACPPATLGALAEQFDDQAARRALGELDRRLYGPARPAGDAAALAGLVRQVRRAWRRTRARAPHAVI